MSSKSKLSFQKEIPHTSSGSTGSAYTPYVSFLPQLDPKTISNPTNHHPRQKDRETRVASSRLGRVASLIQLDYKLELLLSRSLLFLVFVLFVEVILVVVDVVSYISAAEAAPDLRFRGRRRGNRSTS
ncbi:hypothetical protein CUMW_272710 [Citrus unshiu]|uniref:Transmembrane protein n=1 Tax=Citrus unshiu TaxID=55188 RepID=A0A2H5MVS5_CITUN|nr:hypothetical protein CUMW_272710 [Citrus unshiu]